MQLGTSRISYLIIGIYYNIAYIKRTYASTTWLIYYTQRSFSLFKFYRFPLFNILLLYYNVLAYTATALNRDFTVYDRSRTTYNIHVRLQIQVPVKYLCTRTSNDDDYFEIRNSNNNNNNNIRRCIIMTLVAFDLWMKHDVVSTDWKT